MWGTGIALGKLCVYHVFWLLYKKRKGLCSQQKTKNEWIKSPNNSFSIQKYWKQMIFFSFDSFALPFLSSSGRGWRLLGTLLSGDREVTSNSGPHPHPPNSSSFYITNSTTAFLRYCSRNLNSCPVYEWVILFFNTHTPTHSRTRNIQDTKQLVITNT